MGPQRKGGLRQPAMVFATHVHMARERAREQEARGVSEQLRTKARKVRFSICCIQRMHQHCLVYMNTDHHVLNVHQNIKRDSHARHKKRDLFS